MGEQYSMPLNHRSMPAPRAFATVLLACLGVALAVHAIDQTQNNEPDHPVANVPGKEPRKAWEPIVLKDDDKPAFPLPKSGWDVRREGIPHGKLEMMEYDSKTVGTRRK